MPPTEPLAGTFDLVGGPADRTELATQAMRQAFRQFGYEPVAPPILERAGPFLDRSGEDIRGRMYIFADPSGREVCLRPELTIPTARLYADKCKGENQLLRAFYVGPVFRYDKPREGQYRQFTQVGAEFIGESDECLADAEALALAMHALRCCGLVDLHVAVSDIQFFARVFDDPRLSPAWQRRLRNQASDPRAIRRLLQRASETTPAAPAAATDLQRALASVPEGDRSHVLRALLDSFAIDGGFGSRDLNEIVERLLEKAGTGGHDVLPANLADGVTALLDVDEPLQQGLEKVASIASTLELPGLADAVLKWDRRIDLLSAMGIDASSLRLDLSLRRGIAYYSGFVFEIHTGERTPASQVCAGGRYDELVETLGGRSGTPAVGFAMGLERVLRALEATHEPVASALDVFVVGGGDIADFEVVRITRELRAAGLSAVFLNGRRVRYAIEAGLKRGVRYVAVVGKTEMDGGMIVLKDLDSHKQVTSSVEEAARIVRAKEVQE